MAWKFFTKDGAEKKSMGALVLDYAPITSDSATITATTEGTAVAVITGNAITFDGMTPIQVEFWCPWITASGAAATLTFVLLRDSTVLGQAKVTNDVNTGAQGQAPISLKLADTPAVGSHTYKVSAFVSTGNLVVKAGAGGPGNLLPAFLRITRAA